MGPLAAPFESSSISSSNPERLWFVVVSVCSFSAWVCFLSPRSGELEFLSFVLFTLYLSASL